MILLKTFYVWTIAIEITLCLSPAAIVAIAKVQTQKNKALAKALNWKAKNCYKMALAKSKRSKSILGDRFVRDLGAQDGFDADTLNNLPSIRASKSDIGKIEDKFGVENDHNIHSGQKEESDKSDEEKYYSHEKYSQENYGSEYYPEEENSYYEPYDEYQTRSANPHPAVDHNVPFFSQYFPFFQHHEVSNGRKPNFAFNFEDNGENGIHQHQEINNGHKPNVAFSFDEDSGETGMNIKFAMDRQRNPVAMGKDQHINAVQTPGIQPVEQNFNREPFNGEESNFDEQPILGEENQRANENNDEDERLRTFHLPSKSQPDYQDPSYFDTSKPENKIDLVKFIDEQKKLFVNLLPKPKFEKIIYKKPKELYKPKDPYSYGSEEYNYESPDNYYKDPDYDQGYGYSVPRPSPTIHPIKMYSPPNDGKFTKIFNVKHDGVDNLIEILHEKGDLLFDMLRPLTTHFDSHILNHLEHLDKLREAPEDQNIPGGIVGQPLEAPDVHFAVIPTRDMNDPENPIVSHIIRVPNNYYNNYFKRYRRSVTDEDYLKNLIEGRSREIFNRDLKNKMHKLEKRSVPVTPLLMDPSTKIDVSKTLENLGTFVKTIFEHEDTPMYHVRNLLGSSKDTVLATMKIPNQNFITPSGYDIVENPNKDEVINSESPDVSSRFGEEGEISSYWPHDMVTSTFNQVGQVIRNSVRSSQDAINHVGEITNHAKKAIYSAKKAPELIMQSLTPIPLVSATQPISLSSRFGGEDDTVGETEKKPEKFINMGHLLDAVGISNPIRQLPRSSDDLGSTNGDAYVNKLWKNLNGMKDTLGVNDIHDFVLQVKEKLKEFKENNPLKITQIQCGNKRFRRNTDEPEANTVGMSFIPTDLTHPFLNFHHFVPTNFGNNGRTHGEGRIANEENFDPIIGESLSSTPEQCPISQLGLCPFSNHEADAHQKFHEQIEPSLGYGYYWDKDMEYDGNGY